MSAEKPKSTHPGKPSPLLTDLTDLPAKPTEEKEAQQVKGGTPPGPPNRRLS